MKLSEMGKDMKIKHSVSSSLYRVSGDFFRKNLLHGGKNLFTWGLNDQSMQGEKLVVKRFQRSSQVSFPLTDLDLGY